MQIQLSQASGVPYYRQIEDQIAHLVQCGGLTAGEQLPSVRELASELLVSTITVRKAYEDLQSIGLIVLKQGHGTFVAPDVAPALATRAQAEARQALSDAVAQARRAGLSAPDVQSWVESTLRSCP